MSVPKGRNCRIEVAATYGAVKSFSAIAKAVGPLVTAAAHGMVEGTIGFVDIATGLEQLTGQAISVDTTVAGAFNAEGLDTTSYSGTLTTGSITPVSTWLTLTSVTSYNIADAAADDIDLTTLLDSFKQVENGLLAAQTVQFGALSDSQLPAMAIIRAAAINNGFVVFRVTLSNGERRVWRGQPGLPGENQALNAAAQSGLSCKVKGQILSIAAA